jgi:hypothetical protein
MEAWKPVLAVGAAFAVASVSAGCAWDSEDPVVQALRCLGGDHAACQQVRDTVNADADHDGVLDEVDNCSRSNPNQADADGDRLGDVCEEGFATPGPGRARPAAAKPVFSLKLRALRDGIAKVSLRGGKVVAKGGFAAGLFDGRLPGGDTGLPASAKSANWRGAYGFTIDPVTHVVTQTGVALLDFPAPTQGSLCVAFTTRFKAVGGKLIGTGTLKTLGGTGSLARAGFDGTYKSARTADRTFSMRGKGQARRAASGSLPSRCRAVANHR